MQQGGCCISAERVAERVSPSRPALQVKQINASILTDALNNGLSGWTGDSSAAGRFPQVRLRAERSCRFVCCCLMLATAAIIAGFPCKLLLRSLCSGWKTCYCCNTHTRLHPL